MSIEEQILIIRRNDFLDKLSPADYENLNILHNYIVADKDAYIYFDAQYLNKLYFVKEGFVKIGNINDNGEELVKEILKPGDVFGQFMLERNNMLGEFAKAHKCETILCAFTLSDFEKLLTVRPDMAIVFSRKIGQKLKNVENRLLNLLQKDVRTRILYFFWTLVQQTQSANEISITLPNVFTHEDIARLTATSRQTVTKLVNDFSTEGILSLERKQINIHNVKLLQKEAKVS
jgi:CRP/FNR family transcriptional regulator, cyclic AMP receptor protein